MIQEQLFTGDGMRTGSVYALLNIAFYVEFYIFFSASIKELDNFIKELDKLKILSLHSSHLKSRPPGRAKKGEGIINTRNEKAQRSKTIGIFFLLLLLFVCLFVLWILYLILFCAWTAA